MIQKVEHLKKGDLVVVTSNNYNQKSVYLKHVKRDNLIASITYLDIKYNDESRINTRHSTTQRIFKITEDNLDAPELSVYKNILVKLGINPISDYLTLKDGDKIRTSKLYEYIENDNKLSLVREMNNSNDLGLRRNKEIADELFHKPDELIKEIFKNAINL
jgi:hypothetical protein